MMNDDDACSGLNNDHVYETFPLRCTVDGNLFPCRYIRLGELLTASVSLNYGHSIINANQCIRLIQFVAISVPVSVHFYERLSVCYRCDVIEIYHIIPVGCQIDTIHSVTDVSSIE